jgi:predicted amidophosphoribosyltransferase
MLAPCVECGKEISSHAEACPHCGKPLGGCQRELEEAGKEQSSQQLRWEWHQQQSVGRVLIPCLDCGRKVSSKAKQCPGCGRPLDDSYWKSHCDEVFQKRFNAEAVKQMWGCIGAVLIVLGGLAFGVWKLWAWLFSK